MAEASFRPLFFGGESKQGTRTTERRDETKQKESTYMYINIYMYITGRGINLRDNVNDLFFKKML